MDHLPEVDSNTQSKALKRESILKYAEDFKVTLNKYVKIFLPSA
jgi:hypothetical protein